MAIRAMAFSVGTKLSRNRICIRIRQPNQSQ